MGISCKVKGFDAVTTYSKKLQSCKAPATQLKLSDDIVLLTPATLTFVGGDAATVHMPDFFVNRDTALAAGALLAFGFEHTAHTRNA